VYDPSLRLRSMDIAAQALAEARDAPRPVSDRVSS
jgi:hypothetical protein